MRSKQSQTSVFIDRPNLAADRTIAPPARRLTESRLHEIIGLLGIAGSAPERRAVLLAEYQSWSVERIAAELAMPAGRVMELLASVKSRRQLAERHRRADEILAADLAEKPDGHPWMTASDITAQKRRAKRRARQARQRRLDKARGMAKPIAGHGGEDRRGPKVVRP